MESWLDNIKDWTKQPTARLLCVVEDRQRWRIRVVKASTVSPQQVAKMFTGKKKTAYLSIVRQIWQAMKETL